MTENQFCGSGALLLLLPLPGKSEDRFLFCFRFHASRWLPWKYWWSEKLHIKNFRQDSTNAIFETAFQIQPKNIFFHNLKKINSFFLEIASKYSHGSRSRKQKRKRFLSTASASTQQGLSQHFHFRFHITAENLWIFSERNPGGQLLWSSDQFALSEIMWLGVMAALRKCVGFSSRQIRWLGKLTAKILFQKVVFH